MIVIFENLDARKKLWLTSLALPLLLQAAKESHAAPGTHNATTLTKPVSKANSAINVDVQKSSAAPVKNGAQTGWILKQLCLAAGKQQVLVTSKALLVSQPKQAYRIYSTAPNWNVIFINDATKTYLDFDHKKFLGSLIGRLGNEISNQTQFIKIAHPIVKKTAGHEIANYTYQTSNHFKNTVVQGSTERYAILTSFTGSYLREPLIPLEAKRLLCRIGCVPMTDAIPLSFKPVDGFGESYDVIATLEKNENKSLKITPPDLSGLKKVKSESELFDSGHLTDVLEFYDDSESLAKKRTTNGHR